MFVIFPEIQGLRFYRDPLTGVIFEAAALISFSDDAVLGTQDLVLVHGGAVGTVAAGTGDLFSEQHDIDLSFVLRALYMDRTGKSTPIPHFFLETCADGRCGYGYQQSDRSLCGGSLGCLEDPRER